MTIYETIKVAISVKQAAEHYGLKVNRNGMACCPFHNDRHPSMKLNEDYFFCFGCGSGRFRVKPKIRSQLLCCFIAAQIERPCHEVDHIPLDSAAKAEEMLCFRVLMDYLHLLEDWKVRYATKTPDDDLDDRFVEACQMIDYIEYLADILTVGILPFFPMGQPLLSFPCHIVPKESNLALLH